MCRRKKNDKPAKEVANMSEYECNVLLRKYYERTLFLTGISIGLSFAAVLVTVLKISHILPFDNDFK